MVLKLTTDRYPPIMSQTRFPLLSTGRFQEQINAILLDSTNVHILLKYIRNICHDVQL